MIRNAYDAQDISALISTFEPYKAFHLTFEIAEQSPRDALI
jgi:hypothetical protein